MEKCLIICFLVLLPESWSQQIEVLPSLNVPVYEGANQSITFRVVGIKDWSSVVISSNNKTSEPIALFFRKKGCNNSVPKTSHDVSCEFKNQEFKLNLVNVKASQHNEIFTFYLTRNKSDDKLHNSSRLLVLAPIKTVKMHLNNSLTAIKDKKENVSCATSSYPAANITWHIEKLSKHIPIDITYNATERSFERKNKKIETESILTYYGNVEDRDSLIYCSATNGIKNITISSDKKNITIHYPPVLRINRKNQEKYLLREGQSQKFECVVDASPPVFHMVWFSQGTGRRKQLTQFNNLSVIELQKVNRSNSLNYTCQVTNGIGGHFNKSFIVEVLYGPNLSVKDLSTITENDNVTLTCIVEANPKPNIWWMFENRNIRLPCNYQEKKTNFYHCYHIIPTITREKKGVYTCHAENEIYVSNTKKEIFSTNVSVTVNVQYGPENSLKIVNSSERITITEGENVTVKCNADCNPACNYMWLRNDTEVSNTSELSLVDSGRHMNGEYVCMAENNVSNSTRKENVTLILQITYATTITSLSVLNNKTTVDEHSNISIYCNATGLPLPNIAWIRTNNRTYLKREENTTRSVFTIQDVDCADVGHYSCRAHNGIGEPSTKEIYVNVKCHKTRKKNNKLLVYTLAASLPSASILTLIGALYYLLVIKRKRKAFMIGRKKKSVAQITIPDGYDGSYRDNELYVSCEPGILDGVRLETDKRRNSNEPKETTFNTYERDDKLNKQAKKVNFELDAREKARQFAMKENQVTYELDFKEEDTDSETFLMTESKVTKNSDSTQKIESSNPCEYGTGTIYAISIQEHYGVGNINLMQTYENTSTLQICAVPYVNETNLSEDDDDGPPVPTKTLMSYQPDDDWTN